MRSPTRLLLLALFWLCAACVVNPVPTPGEEGAANIGLQKTDDVTTGDIGGQGEPTGTIDAGAGPEKDVSPAPLEDAGAAEDAATWPGEDIYGFDVSAGDTGSAEVGQTDPDGSGSDIADTGSSDTGSADTGSADTGGGDTVGVDTVGADTNPAASPDAGPDSCPKPTGALSVLFLGNSYTSANDLPGMLGKLSGSLGKTIDHQSVTTGGWTLGATPNDHASDPDSLNALVAKPWHAVVLQEQSQIPVIPPFNKTVMLPGAKKLVAKLQSSNTCAKVLLFLTWGRKKGGKQCAGVTCSPPFADFGEMQDALTAAYLDVAKQVGGAVVPVGEAWRKAIDAGGIELFSADGSHPSVAGTYLAAATFHAALFKQSPAKASFVAGLSKGEAGKLVGYAAATVLDDPGKWGL